MVQRTVAVAAVAAAAAATANTAAAAVAAAVAATAVAAAVAAAIAVAVAAAAVTAAVTTVAAVAAAGTTFSAVTAAAVAAAAAATLQRAAGWSSPLPTASGPCGTGRLCRPPAGQMRGRQCAACRVPRHPAQYQVVSCSRPLSARRSGRPRRPHGQTTIRRAPPVQRDRFPYWGRVVRGRELPRQQRRRASSRIR